MCSSTPTKNKRSANPPLFTLRLLPSLFIAFLLVACESDDLPTPVALVPTVALDSSEETVVAEVSLTATPLVVQNTATPEPTQPLPATNTPLPTDTQAPPTATSTVPPLPSETLTPTETAVLPTRTPVPPTATMPATAPPATAPPATAPPPTAPPASPTIPAEPVLGANVLPNPSFEEGWYNQNGIPELQLPNSWSFEWDEGPTGFGSQPWDVYVRPETRVLPSTQLPPAEHPLFLWDGQYTIKMFKGSGAISFRLTTDVFLQPGTYVFEINLFPDLVMAYANGQKVWADDPLAGEVRFIQDGGGTDWFLPAFGQKNTFTYTFTINEARTVRLGIGIRGRFAIANNGWFFDDWSLRRVDG